MSMTHKATCSGWTCPGSPGEEIHDIHATHEPYPYPILRYPDQTFFYRKEV